MPHIGYKPPPKVVRVKNPAKKLDTFDIKATDNPNDANAIELILNTDEIYLIKDMIRYFRKMGLSPSNEVFFEIHSDSILNKIHEYLSTIRASDKREYITFQVKPNEKIPEDKLIDQLRKMSKQERLDYWRNQKEENNGK